MKSNTSSAPAHTIAYFKAGQFGTPFKPVTIPEVYELIKTGEDVRKVTNFIRRKHGKGIEEGFKTISKALYQDHKRDYLNAVTFSGNIDRSKSKKPAYRHTGLICLDIDENSEEDYKILLHLTRYGYLPYFEAVGRSISGALWANACIDIPEDIQGNYDKLEAVHKRYHSALTNRLYNIVIVHLEDETKRPKDTTVIRVPGDTLTMLEINTGHELKIVVGNSSDPKRLRYVTHDPGLIVREAKPVTYADLEALELFQQKEQQVKHIERKALNINASSHFDYCHQFARGVHTDKWSFDFVPGQRNEYLARFCMASNFIGIPEEDARDYMAGSDLSEHSRAVEVLTGTYKRYGDNFGRWKDRVKIEQKTFLPMDVNGDTFLTFDTFLTDSPDFPKLLDRIDELSRSLLVVPTGSGKTVSSVKELRARFKAQYPDKVFVFVTPLTAITEQIGLEYGQDEDNELQIICKGYDNYKRASFVDTITTASSFVLWSERLHEADQLKDIILVFDEAHELITGAGYQNFGTLPHIFDQVFKVIGLTATPLHPLQSHFGFTPIKCDRRNSPAVNIEYKRIKQDQLYSAVIDFGKQHRREKSLYFYDSKPRIEGLAKALKRRGLNADYYHAGVKDTKAGVYRHLIDNKTLPAGTNNLLCTKILSFGTSFYGLDNIVYITRSDRKDFLAFVQSIARLREQSVNVTVFIIEPKTEGERKYRPYDFDLEKYADEYARLQHLADEYNRHEKNRAKYDTGNGYKNSVPERYRRLIKRNKLTGKYEVDGLTILYDQFQDVTRAYSADDFIRLFQLIPNVSVVEANEEAVLTAEVLNDIKEIEAEAKQQEEADTEALKELLSDHQEEVFKYVYLNTEDEILKSKIQNELRIVKAVDDLKDTAVIDRRFGIAQNAVRRYIGLTNDYTNAIDKDRLVEYCFYKSINFQRLRRQLNSLYNVQEREAGTQGLEYGHASGLLCKRITDAQLQLIAFVECLQSRTIPIGELSEQVERLDWYKTLELNTRTWTRELAMFYDVTKHRTNKERYMNIGKRLYLKDVIGDNVALSIPKKKAV